MKASAWRTYLGPAVLLMAAVFLAYLPVLRNGFVTLDDPITILDNPQSRSLSWENLKWMFTTFSAENWVPLVWFSFALDYWVAGPQPWMYHLTNLVLHSLNTVLVFLLFLRFLSWADPRPAEKTFHGQAAFWAALWFGVHPIHVESVAWASERKDVLYAFFYLAALWVYLGVPGESRSPRRLWTCFGLFLLALLSKPMAVSLPLILLLFDVWPLRRWEKEGLKILKEKIFFFILAAGGGAAAMLSHGLEHSTATLPGLTMTFRVMNSFRTMVFYALKTFWPTDLAPLYPLPRGVDDLYYLQNWAALGLVLVLFVAAWVCRRKIPAFGAALGFYVLTLLPVLGLVQTGGQWAADRYTYLAGSVFFLSVSWGFVGWSRDGVVIRRILGVLVAVLLGALTWNQLSVWQDPIHFWERVVTRFPGQSLQAHTNLGMAYRQAGRSQDALDQYDQALQLSPQEAFLHDDRGMVLLDFGRAPEAIREFQRAIVLHPDDAAAYRGLWFAERKEGRAAQAWSAIQKAVALDPSSAEAWNNLGVSEAEAGKRGQAVVDLQKAVALEPVNPSYLLNLAKADEEQKNWAQSIEGYQKVLRFTPNNATAWFDLGETYQKIGNWGGAWSALENADRLAPGNTFVKRHLLETQKRLKKAPSH